MKKMTLGLVVSVMLVAAQSVKAASGINVCEIGISTGAVPVLCAKGTQTVYAVVLDSSAGTSEYLNCYDSNSVVGFATGSTPDGTPGFSTRVATAQGGTAPVGGVNKEAASGIFPQVVKGIVCIKQLAGSVGRVLFGN